MKRLALNGFLGAVVLLLPSLGQAESLKKLRSTLEKSGVIMTSCPKYMVGLNTGRLTPFLPTASAEHLFCIRSGNVGAAYSKKPEKAPKFAPMILNGKYDRGTPFPPIEDQEGDVQTEPFTVANAPAIIRYSVSDASLGTEFTIKLLEASTGRVLETLYRVKGERDGHFAWNYPGKYYLRLQAKPDSGEKDPDFQGQPKFSVSVEFSVPEPGEAVTAAELREVGVKTVPCPTQLFDSLSRTLFKIPAKGIACARKGTEEAEFVPAPINTTHNLFLKGGLEVEDSGDYVSLPVRVLGPTPFTYSVDDPTSVSGKLRINLINLTTGRSYNLVSVTGSISSTTTSINIPGDYFFFVKTSPRRPAEHGDISWSFSIGEPE